MAGDGRKGRAGDGPESLEGFSMINWCSWETEVIFWTAVWCVARWELLARVMAWLGEVI